MAGLRTRRAAGDPLTGDGYGLGSETALDDVVGVVIEAIEARILKAAEARLKTDSAVLPAVAVTGSAHQKEDCLSLHLQNINNIVGGKVFVSLGLLKALRDRCDEQGKYSLGAYFTDCIGKAERAVNPIEVTSESGRVYSIIHADHTEVIDFSGRSDNVPHRSDFGGPLGNLVWGLATRLWIDRQFSR